MEKLGEDGVPFVMVFTKTDKQSTSRTNELINTYLAKMSDTWDEADGEMAKSISTETV